MSKSYTKFADISVINQGDIAVKEERAFKKGKAAD